MPLLLFLLCGCWLWMLGWCACRVFRWSVYVSLFLFAIINFSIPFIIAKFAL